MTKVHDSATPAHGQQVFTACAIIHHKFDGVEKAFMAKRAASKKFLPGIFEFPGGHIDYGEDLIKGLQREVLEELGMHITVGEVVGVFTYLNEVKGSHSIEVVYLAQFTDPLENITLDPEDHSEFIWIGADEIPKAYTPGKQADNDEIKLLVRGFELLA